MRSIDVVPYLDVVPHLGMASVWVAVVFLVMGADCSANDDDADRISMLRNIAAAKRKSELYAAETARNLEHENPRVRIAAAVAWRAIGRDSGETLAVLESEMRSEKLPVAAEASAALAELGADGVSHLIRHLKTPRFRSLSLYGLTFAPPHLVRSNTLATVLRSELTDPSGDANVASCLQIASQSVFLAPLCAEQALTYLTHEAHDADAAAVFLRFNVAKHVPALLALLGSNELDNVVAGDIARSCALAGSDGIKGLIDVLERTKSSPRAFSIFRGLDAAQEESVKQLLLAARSENANLRRWSVAALETSRTLIPATFDVVLGALHDTASEVRMAACHSAPEVAARVKNPSADQLGALRRACGHSDPSVRIAAYRSMLALIEEADVTEALIRGLSDASLSVQKTCAFGVAKLVRKARGIDAVSRAVPQLMDLARSRVAFESSSEALSIVAPSNPKVVQVVAAVRPRDSTSVKVASSLALARIGPRARRSEQAIASFLRSEDFSVRIVGAYAHCRVMGEYFELFSAASYGLHHLQDLNHSEFLNLFSVLNLLSADESRPLLAHARDALARTSTEKGPPPGAAKLAEWLRVQSGPR